MWQFLICFFIIRLIRRGLVSPILWNHGGGYKVLYKGGILRFLGRLLNKTSYHFDIRTLKCPNVDLMRHILYHWTNEKVPKESVNLFRWHMLAANDLRGTTHDYLQCCHQYLWEKREMEAGLVCLGKNAGGWTNHACEKGEQWQHVLDLFEKMPLDHLQCCHQHLWEKREMAAGLVSLGKHACEWVNNACGKGEQKKCGAKVCKESHSLTVLPSVLAWMECNGSRPWIPHHWTDAAKIVVLSSLVASAGNRYGMTLRAF